MRRIASRLLPCALVGALFAPVPAQAQIGDWTFSATADFGGNFPIRQLGKNAGGLQELPVLQVVAERSKSLTIGGGVLATSPSGETTVRARYYTTINGEVSGRVGFCGSPDQPLLTGVLCLPAEATAQVNSFAVDMGFLQGAPGDRIRASIHFGAGLRSFSFGATECADPDAQRTQVCEFIVEIWEDDGGVSPFLLAGLRLNGELGPAKLWVEAMDQIGRYDGGSARADGNVQNDVGVSAGFSIRVF